MKTSDKEELSNDARKMHYVNLSAAVERHLRDEMDSEEAKIALSELKRRVSENVKSKAPMGTGSVFGG